MDKPVSPPAILLVEDNPLSRKVARLALEGEGYEVHEASTGGDALEWVEGAVPDLILQDIKLPDMNGLDLVARFRALPNGRAVPIIALTGFRSELEHARSAMAGFSEILFKPTEPSVLVRVIRAHLRPPPAPDAVDRRRLLLVDDDPVQLKLGALHLAAAGFEVQTARDGAEGLDQMRTWAPHIVVSDVLMPRLDGFQFCSALKRDVLWRTIPVVLTSSAFLEAEDVALAREMGADTLVARSPGFSEIVEAVEQALRAPRTPGRDPAKEPPTKWYAERTWNQLEQQVRLNASLSQRLALRGVELAMLAATAEAITADPSGFTVQSVLEHAFNACGISRSAVYLVQPDGALALHVAIGPDAALQTAVATFLGRATLLQGVLQAGDPQVIADASGGLGAVIVAPLRRGGDTVGLLWMQLDSQDGPPAEWVPFAAAVGSQLAQAIALSQAYAAAEAGREASGRDALRREQLQIKDQFLSHVSHELGTPLTAIHQFVTIILDGLAGEVSAEQREYLEIALRNVHELRVMINDLLEATRSETARLSIAPRPVQLVHILDEVIASLRLSAAHKGVRVAAHADAALPDAHADPARVGQIISNLIGNAVKFTPQGGTVAIRVHQLQEDGDMLRVSVEDTGPGIQPEDRERIFDYLYQGANTADLARKGFGIGLYICRDLVLRQGGRIWAESEPGRGSAFHFTLPVAAEAGATHVA